VVRGSRGPGRSSGFERRSLRQVQDDRLLVRNLIRVIDHAAQLNLFLNLKAGLSDSRWTGADRWFRRCPDCP